MRSISVSSLARVILLAIIFALSFKLFPAWISPLRREWLLLVFAVLFLAIMPKPRSVNDKNILFTFGLFSFYLIIKSSIGTFLYPRLSFAIYDILMLFVAFYLPLIILLKNDRKFMGIIIYGSFILLAIECVSSFFILRSNPGIIRNMYTMIQESGVGESYGFFRLGLADYGQCHALPIVIPPLFYIIKTNESKRIRNWCIASIFVCILLTYLSESTTAFLLALLMLLLGFFTNERRTNLGVVILIFLFIPFLLFDELQLFVLDSLGAIVGYDSIFYEKIEDIEYLIINSEQIGDLAGRVNRYKTSWGVFVSSPLIGSSAVVGRHSALLDRLATLGLVGFIPLVVFFYFYSKKIIQIIPSNAKLFYLEAVMAGMLMLLAKGMWLWIIFFFMMIVAPLLFVFNFNKHK